MEHGLARKAWHDVKLSEAFTANDRRVMDLLAGPSGIDNLTYNDHGRPPLGLPTGSPCHRAWTPHTRREDGTAAETADEEMKIRLHSAPGPSPWWYSTHAVTIYHSNFHLFNRLSAPQSLARTLPIFSARIPAKRGADRGLLCRGARYHTFFPLLRPLELSFYLLSHLTRQLTPSCSPLSLVQGDTSQRAVLFITSRRHK